MGAFVAAVDAKSIDDELGTKRPFGLEDLVVQQRPLAAAAHQPARWRLSAPSEHRGADAIIGAHSRRMRGGRAGEWRLRDSSRARATARSAS